jgi:DNA-binding winged helix-turn-helix (wHTH) protein
MRLLFGEYEFDSGRRLLLRHGLAVALSTRAFLLLQVLLDRRPEAVSKGDLLEHLWPDTFVSDGSLHNLVAEVRRALGDTTSATRYVRTVPRYGYAFCGEAHLAVAPAAPRSEEAGACLIRGRDEWPLSDGESLVGRDRDCVVRIDAAAVSRHHARIVLSDGQAWLEDLGSKNGTLVNGWRVGGRTELEDGDEIRVGSVSLTYRVLGSLPSTATERL